MSAEGDHNLDNDAAGDLLLQISEDLFTRVTDLLQDQIGHHYDDDQIGELFVRIEMIFALHAREMIAHAPKQEDIEILIDPFVERWQQYHREADHEPPAIRLQSMRETFAQLLEVIREVHDNSPGFGPVEIDWDSPDLPPEHRMVLDAFDRVAQRSNHSIESI